MPSESCNPSANASTDEAEITSILRNITKIGTTTAIEVFNVSQHELQHVSSRRTEIHNDLFPYGDQEQRRLSERRGPLHRVASRLLARATTADAPIVLRRRRHSTPTAIVEEASHMVQEFEREQSHGQSRKPRPSRRKSLLNRARSLRGVKSLSDLKAIARRRELKGQHESPLAKRQGQARERIDCAVVRMRSVNSAASAPLYLLRAAE